MSARKPVVGIPADIYALCESIAVVLKLVSSSFQQNFKDLLVILGKNCSAVLGRMNKNISHTLAIKFTLLLSIII